MWLVIVQEVLTSPLDIYPPSLPEEKTYDIVTSESRADSSAVR